MAAPKNKSLKQFNSYLEEVRGKLARHYRELQMKGERLTAAAVKDAYGGIIKEKKYQYHTPRYRYRSGKRFLQKIITPPLERSGFSLLTRLFTHTMTIRYPSKTVSGLQAPTANKVPVALHI